MEEGDGPAAIGKTEGNQEEVEGGRKDGKSTVSVLSRTSG